ncbi:MAG TPA: hypothetical protein VJ997_01675, partial [Longimicrobiales bacterium]|nr:hypothetical protein [Longimicrobiales bacterium]
MSARVRGMRIGLAVVALLAVAGRPVRAQQAETARLVTRALALQRGADFTSAVGLLTDALARCPAAGEPTSCAPRLYYALGYISQEQASRAPGQRDELLQSAAEYYQSVLSATPANTDAVYNLAIVYRQMGAHEWQQQFFEEAGGADPARAALYDVLRGDYYGEQGLGAQSLRAYEEAVRVSPDDDVARSRLVAATADPSAAPALPRLMRVYESWEARYPDAALEGYLAIMRAGWTSEVELARRALVRWTSLMARQRRVSPGILAALPADWQDRAVQDLAAYLDDPMSRPGADNWWLQGEDRTEAMAGAGLALGDGWVANGSYAWADSCWNVALRLVGPDATTAIDLARELSLLYFRVPSLDPDGRRFRSLEDRLFSQKGGAIIRGDLPAAQRFHTVLGLIYASTGRWRGDGARNATYQLEHALQTAAARDRTQSSYQPLGGMRELLGRAYAESDRRGGAAETYLAAARAYLDSDQPRDAQRSLEQAQEAGSPMESVAALTRVLDVRRRITAADAGSPALREACDAPGLTSVLTALGGTDDDGFVDRQRFKLWSDCSLAGASGGARQAAAAVQLVASKRMPLASLGDLRRLEGVHAAALAGVGLAANALA